MRRTLSQKTPGITLVGPPGSGKTTISKLASSHLPSWHLHDMDDDGMEQLWGKGGVHKKLTQLGDAAFLETEGRFVRDYYGRPNEGKRFSLGNMLFASSGSLPLAESAMDYIRDRTITVLLDVPKDEIVRRLRVRGVDRIVGMNRGKHGELAQFSTIEEVLDYRQQFYDRSHDYRLRYGSAEETAKKLIALIHSIA